MLVDPVSISRAAQTANSSRPQSPAGASFADALTASDGDAAPQTSELASAPSNSAGHETTQANALSSRTSDLRATNSVAKDDSSESNEQPATDSAVKTTVSAPAANVKAITKAKLKDRSASGDDSIPIGSPAQKDSVPAPGVASPNSPPAARPSNVENLDDVADSLSLANAGAVVVPPLLSSDATLPETEAGIIPTGGRSSTPPAGQQSPSQSAVAVPGWPPRTPRVGDVPQNSLPGKVAAGDSQAVGSPQTPHSLEPTLISFNPTQAADGESAATNELADIGVTDRESAAQNKASGTQAQSASSNKLAVKVDQTSADSARGSSLTSSSQVSAQDSSTEVPPQVSFTDPAFTRPLPASEIETLPSDPRMSPLTGGAFTGPVRPDRNVPKETASSEVVPSGSALASDINFETKEANRLTALGDAPRPGPRDNAPSIPDLPQKNLPNDSLLSVQSKIDIPLSGDGMQVDKPPHGATMPGSSTSTNDTETTRRPASAQLTITQDPAISAPPTISASSDLISISQTAGADSAAGIAVQSSDASVGSTPPATADPKPPTTLVPKDDNSTSSAPLIADRSKPSFTASPGQLVSGMTPATITAHDSINNAGLAATSPAPNNTDPPPAIKSTPLPSAHQALDSVPVPISIASSAASSIPHPLADSNSLQMRLDVHTNAFGNVEIHTVIEQAQVGVAIHSDRDLSRWFNSEVGGLETELKNQHLDLAGVNFSSNRSGVQTATSFQQGQARQQNLFQPSTPQSKIPQLPGVETDSRPEPNPIAALPVVMPETRVSFLA